MFTQNCRICLSDQSDNAMLLFTTDQNNVKLLSETGEMYLDCLRLELIDDHGYPRHICHYCNLQLSLFHNFMMMAKRSFEKFVGNSRVIKSEEVNLLEPEIDNFDEPYDPDGAINKSLLNSSRNSDAEYLDLDEDAGYDVSVMGDSILNEFTVEQPEDDMGDCMVEYLDEDDVIVTNIKNEIIEVKDEVGDEDENLSEQCQDDVISYNSDDSNEILESSSKTSNISQTYFQLELLNGDLKDELVDENCKKNSVYPKNYECKQCNFIFSSAHQLREHYLTKPECKQDCEICGRKFKTRVMYQSHMNVHNGLPAFKCEICDKTFNFRSNYQTHMLLHTNERPFQCNMCDKGFRSKWDLIIHTRVHNDIRKYECKICGKRFRVSSHLTSHQYTHAEEKLFECDLCHQRYNSPRTLKQHKNTVHSNNYRFFCSQCDKKFKRKHHVLSHLKIHFKDNVDANVLNVAKLEYRDEL